jgi:hypothetical protein
MVVIAFTMLGLCLVGIGKVPGNISEWTTGDYSIVVALLTIIGRLIKHLGDNN